MKHTIIILISLFYFLQLQGQEKHLSEIDWGNKVRIKENRIFAFGNKYFKKNSSFSTLYCLNNDLKTIWTLKLDSYHTNTIDEIAFWNDNIIITGVLGERTSQTENATRYVYIISQNGKITKKINLGSSTGKCTNLIINGNELSICYKYCSTIYYAEMMNTSFSKIALVNLKNYSVKYFQHFLERSTPEKLLKHLKSTFVIGSQYKNEKYNVTENFIHNIQDKNRITKVFKADSLENFANAMSDKEGITIFSYSNPFSTSNNYFRIDYLDNEGKTTNQKLIKFEDLEIKTISLYIPKSLDTLWVYGGATDDKNYFFKLNRFGELIDKIQADSLEINSYDYSIENNKIIHLYRREDKVYLKAYKIEK